jgi:hypothetical protein
MLKTKIMQERTKRIQKPYEKKVLRKYIFDIKVHETTIPTHETEEHKSKLHFWIILQCNVLTVVSHYTAQHHSSEDHNNHLSLPDFRIP